MKAMDVLCGLVLTGYAVNSTHSVVAGETQGAPESN